MSKKILVLALGLVLTFSMGVSVAGTLTSTADKFSHDNSAGGQGTERILLKAPQGRCAVFDGAKLEFSKRRYGKASITSLPSKGCNPAKNACRLTIKWEHRPAGSLSYKVQVKWKTASGC